MTKHPPKKPPIEEEELESQDTLEQSVDTVEIARRTLAKPVVETKPRITRPDSPRVTRRQDSSEESSRWQALVNDVADERAHERTEPMPAAADTTERREPQHAGQRQTRHWRRASERRPRLPDLADVDIETTVDEPGFDEPPPEWYSQTKPEMQLTQRMQERFVAELRTELEPGEDGDGPTAIVPTKAPQPPRASVWEQFPATTSDPESTSAEQEVPEASHDSVTLVSRPVEVNTAGLDETVQARAVDALRREAVTPHAVPTSGLEQVFPPRDGMPFGSYWLLRRLKAGGMGEVYMAVASEVAGVVRTVAIKRILLPLTESEQFVAMFISEAKIMVQLNHAAIVQVYELGQVGQQYFIAMEYVHGRDLDSIMRDAVEHRELLPVPVAVYVAQQLLEGLDYAHRRTDARGKRLGIVHRDVSPPNILCSYEGHVKLTDFGIAKAAVKVSMTRPGLVLGKTGYMSPEQIKSEDIDHRSDLFAVGVVLWELLSGRRLFRATNDAQTIRNVLMGEIPPLHTLRGEVSRELSDVVHWALERDRERRPQSAAELGERLQQVTLAAGIRNPKRDLIEYMSATYGGSHAGEPIFRRRG